MVDIFKIGLIIPCSGSYDDIVVLNIAIVSVLYGRASGTVTSALKSCLASISDGFVKAVRSVSSRSSLTSNRTYAIDFAVKASMVLTTPHVLVSNMLVK